MKNSSSFLFLFLGIILTLVFSFAVFAAGGGGGGSGGSPSPPPAEPPSSSSIPPAESSPPPPECTEDTWNCTDWSACQMNGHQTRSCSFVKDCPGVSTPVPERDQVCSGLKCGQKETLPERVQCRLQLTPEELAAEYAILYFPEYCKSEETPAEQQECIVLYRSLQPCWKMPFGEERAACGRKTVGLKRTLSKERVRCAQKKTDVARRFCRERLNEKIENHTLFQMYEYEWQAEALLKQGKAPLDQVVEFDVFVEQTKQEVNREETLKAWRQLLEKVQAQFASVFGSL